MPAASRHPTSAQRQILKRAPLTHHIGRHRQLRNHPRQNKAQGSVVGEIVEQGVQSKFDSSVTTVTCAGDGRDAAVEFALDPLLNDLTNNRPLRLVLPGVITELPVPPYVVGEWRSLQDLPLS